MNLQISHSKCFKRAKLEVEIFRREIGARGRKLVVLNMWFELDKFHQ
jgi:hypothetical protein